MKLYEGIQQVVNEFGKKSLLDSKVINILKDYNAFEESKAFNVILKNVISEGYMEHLMHIQDWRSSKDRVIDNFIIATSFNEHNATYVINSIAYGLGLVEIIPVYHVPSPNSKSQANSSNASSSTSSQKSPLLDKTRDDFYNMSKNEILQYKTDAEKYLSSVIEYKTDIEKDLGVKITPNSYFMENRMIRLTFGISGTIKVDFLNSINFHLLVYNQSDAVVAKKDMSIFDKTSYELLEVMIIPQLYNRVCDIKRLVLYYNID